jgi:hypothetical protein
VLPGFVDGAVIVQILLIELVFQPTIDAKIRIGFEGHIAGRPSYPSYRAPGDGQKFGGRALARL